MTPKHVLDIACDAHVQITAQTKIRNNAIKEARKHGFGYREIAEAIGISAGTVSSILAERRPVRERA